MSSTLVIAKSHGFFSETEEIQLTPIIAASESKVWHITSGAKQYIYRRLPGVTQENFDLEKRIIEMVASLGFGPRLLTFDYEDRGMLLEYIPHRPWPEFSINKIPFQEAMRALRCIHSSIHVDLFKEKSAKFIPFSFISGRSYILQRKYSSWLPNQLDEALQKINSIRRHLTPWLYEHAVVCHGDCHQGNVLNATPIALIDWTSAYIGHPFFDVAKFSLKLCSNDRLSLLADYLGHDPSDEEKMQFKLVDLALLMVITVHRFFLAHKDKSQTRIRYTKGELERKLNEESLPSFLSVSYIESSAQRQQYAAICALQEFLNRVKEPALAHKTSRSGLVLHL